MKENSILRLLLIPFLLVSFLLTGCVPNDATEEELSGEFGGPTLSSLRRGAAPLAAFDVAQQANPAVGIYKYSVSDAQEVVGTLVVPDDADYDLYFYDTDGNRVAKVETSGNGIDESLEYTIAGFSTLYVVIYDGIGGIHNNEGSNYSFTLSLKADPQEIEMTEVDESTEDNETQETAEVISVNTIVSGSLFYGSDYDDFYTLDVTPGDTLNISLSWEEKPATNILLVLLSEGFSELPLVDDSSNLKEISYTIPDGMTQLVVLANGYDGNTDYKLSIAVSAE